MASSSTVSSAAGASAAGASASLAPHPISNDATIAAERSALSNFFFIFSLLYTLLNHNPLSSPWKSYYLCRFDFGIDFGNGIGNVSEYVIIIPSETFPVKCFSHFCKNIPIWINEDLCTCYNETRNYNVFGIKKVICANLAHITYLVRWCALIVLTDLIISCKYSLHNHVNVLSTCFKKNS